MDFYYHPNSAACRACKLTADALGIKLNLKFVDLMNKEQLKPEFIAINPQHCVPTLVDGDFKLWESRAISAYLVNQYGKDDSLYPNDPKTRAIIDRALYFEMGTLAKRFGEYVYPPLLQGTPADPEKVPPITEALKFLDGFLAGRDYIAGPNITIGDHTLVATYATIEASGIEVSGLPNVDAWFARCKANMPGYEENEQGVKAFADFVKPKLKGK